MSEIEMDIPRLILDSIRGVIGALLDLDPDKDTPAGELLIKIAIAFAEYESNYFKFGKDILHA